MNMTGKEFTRVLIALTVISVFALVAVIVIVRPGIGEPTVVAGTNTAPAESAFGNTGIFAKITLNGAVVEGYVGITEIAGIDLSSDHTKLVWAGFSGRLPASQDGTRTGARLEMEPFTMVKSIDRMTPLLFRAMVQNETVDAEVLIFGTDPDSGASRLEFTYVMTGGRIVSQRVNSSENSSNSAGEFTDTETIAIAFHTLTLTDVIGTTEFEYSSSTGGA